MKRAVPSVLLAACLALASQARADEPSTEALAEARERYDRGRQLFQEGALEAALAELERAYQLAPTGALLYNIGLVHVARSDPASALSAFERYLAEGGSIPDERRSEVETQIARLAPRVAELGLESEAGAELFVDDVPVGTAPLAAPIRVNAGRHRVRASKLGRSKTEVVLVAGAEKRRVVLELEREGGAPVPETAPARVLAPASSPPAPTPAPDAADAPASPPYWIGWVATGILAAGAVTSGAFALAASNELDDQSRSPNVSRAELDDTHDRMRAFAITADLLGAAALITGGVTLYLSLSSERERPRSSAVRLELAPAGARLLGSF
jgi:hypothetical protein